MSGVTEWGDGEHVAPLNKSRTSHVSLASPSSIGLCLRLRGSRLSMDHPSPHLPFLVAESQRSVAHFTTSLLRQYFEQPRLQTREAAWSTNSKGAVIMPIERTPRSPLPQNFHPNHGTAYHVQNGDNWSSIATRAGLNVAELIDFNFGTHEPAEVNWYLRRNVGCRRVTVDGKNYVFSSDANPGIVYLPPPGPRINYAVPGPFNILAQPSSMTCWAAVGAMMISWHDHMSYSIENALSKCGTNWLTKFAKNEGLQAADHDWFVNAAGMQHEPLMSFPAQTWEQMLRESGPVAVVTANPFHARIMVGIRGDGTLGGTTVDLIDPAGGTRYPLPFSIFTQNFEAVVSSPRAQVWRYRPH